MAFNIPKNHRAKKAREKLVEYEATRQKIGIRERQAEEFAEEDKQRMKKSELRKPAPGAATVSYNKGKGK
jgi:hypothetical protein